MIDELLRHNVVMYGKHVDVTSYTNGVRETLNPEGRAHPHVIWDYYSNGCSIRLLNPQYFIPSLHMLLATLQEYFGCLVGANAYLTPPNSQGFAPHYDDIEAFVYQVEGKKHWKVYKPRSVKERLPRYSSPNFSEEEVGTPVLDVILSPGDVLYFPRGFIHHAKTLPGEHSLHITISTYQKSSWCDLLEKVLPLSLKKACEMDVDFRKGLPIGYLQNAGFAHSKAFLRKELIQGLRTFVSKLEQYIDVDSAVDQMGIQFMHDSLPPVFTEDELKCSVYNGGLVMKENGTLENYVQPNFNTKIRLLRAYLCRFVQEDMKLENGAVERQMRLYYNVDNSREYHGEDLQFLLIPPDMIASVHFLICAYPSFVTVNDLPCKTNEEKVLYILMTFNHHLIFIVPT
ncbi:hypothetical protein AAG570_008462 [Ranatra chinensis]|uniref:Bifunctional lysine-specific demethylase and histidyl-hydroxylase n=1 Tax=Ranatra chinensis TaxID=642074 RepID=A0ABD0ZC52_9HEMI